MSAEDLKTGSVLDDTYEIIELIGSGGMGAVWKASHLRLPKEVAIKILKGAVDSSDDSRARFRREAEIASQLGHPHIVEAHDFNTLSDDTPYLVLEFLRGKNLRDRIREGPFELSEVAEVARQVASGLRAAHSKGVIHRDLKPENIFLSQHEGEQTVQAKILDFGISKIQSARTQLTDEGMVMGTPSYMSPEQARGQATDASIDQYALAVIVFEMLTGRPPFSGDSPMAVLYQVVNEDPPDLAALCPQIPGEVVSVILRGMAKSSGARFGDVGAFSDALICAAAGQEVTTSKVAVPESFDEDTALMETGVGVPLTGAEREGSTSGVSTSGVSTSGVSTSDAADDASGPSRGRGGVIVAALLVIATALGVWIWLATPRDGGRARVDGSIAAARLDGTPDGQAPADARLPATPDAKSALPDGGAPDTPATSRRRTPGKKSGRRTVRPLSPENAEKLQKAQAALDRGDHDRAKLVGTRLLMHLPDHQKWRAHSILARVWCALNHMAQHKAHLLNVPARRRAAIFRFCRKHDQY